MRFFIDVSLVLKKMCPILNWILYHLHRFYDESSEICGYTGTLKRWDNLTSLDSFHKYMFITSHKNVRIRCLISLVQRNPKNGLGSKLIIDLY